MTLELTSLIPLVGSVAEDPLAVKQLDNRLCIYILMLLYIFKMPLGLYGQMLVNVVHAMQPWAQVQQDVAEFALVQLGAEQ